MAVMKLKRGGKGNKERDWIERVGMGERRECQGKGDERRGYPMSGVNDGYVY
jgi:hypothetical protein